MTLQPGDQSPRRGPRPRCTVRAGLVEAGVESARSGGPDAVVLREVTRMVGVAPNAAYRHFPVPRRRDQQEHLRFKDAVDQALRVRGSRDFAYRGSYDRP